MSNDLSGPDISCHITLRKECGMATTIRYSEAFKLEVIDSLANCKYKTIADARRAFGITGCGTIERWLVKYGREELLRNVGTISVGETELKCSSTSAVAYQTRCVSHP